MHPQAHGLIRRRHLRRSLSAAVVLGALVGCAREAPAPLPSVLVVVDTDLPVPRAVSRLRVDLYDEGGTWLESRDVPVPRPDEWPVSFGIASPDESRATSLFVRLRAFPEGAVRDYRGEAWAPPTPFAPPHVPASLEELCASLEDLPPFVERTLRRSPKPLTRDTCSTYGGYYATSVTSTGPVAVRVTIPTSGRYRFEVVRSVPKADDGTDTTLSLRRDCARADTEIACADEISALNSLSSLVTDLDAGTYTLLTGGAVPEWSDLTLRWAPEAEWAKPSPSAPPASARAVHPSSWPRLHDDARDVTPSVEPLPAAMTERFVRVRLTPGERGRVRVVLGGACLGNASAVRAADESRIAIHDLRTCIEDGSLAAVPEAAPSPSDVPASIQGSFVAEACAPEESDDEVVCVPGGAFVLGGSDLDGLPGIDRAVPVRVVALRRFFMDRREVTVARYRQARAAGLASGGEGLVVNDGAFDPDDVRGSGTFSTKPGDREHWPLNKITWQYARDVCTFYGGDLPTEAQWEYAATAAGLASKRTFPWGESENACATAVVGRAIGPECKGPKGPEPVDSPVAMQDVNALGIMGLGGNVAEFTRDGAYPYDAPCWSTRSAVDAWCDDPTAPTRTPRGGSWIRPSVMSKGVVRVAQPLVTRLKEVGFRCVYSAPPTRRWTGP